MRKYLLLAVFFLGIATGSYSQGNRITGEVRDSLTKQPLPNASIQLSTIENSQVTKSAITDNKGNFSIRQLPAGWYRLQVQYIGYQTYTRDSFQVGQSAQNLDAIFLALEHRQLKAVVVTAAKPFIVQSADKITLNVAESPVAAGGTAYEVIARAPGVLADQNGNFQVRGRNVAVYIDGRPSHLGNEELKNLLSSLPSSSIDRVEIMVNPPARYDAQGGSVINIISVKNKNLGTNGTITAGIGTGRFGRYNSGLSLNHRNKKTNTYGSYDFQANRQYYHNRSERYLSPALTIAENEYDIRKRYNHAYKAGIDYDVSKRTSAGLLARGFTNFRDRTVTNRSLVDHSSAADSFSTVSTRGYARISNPSLNAYFKTTFDSAGKKEFTFNADQLWYRKEWKDDFTTRFFDEKSSEYSNAVLLRDHSPAHNRILSLAADYSQPLKKGRIELGVKSTFTLTDNDVLWEINKQQAWTNDVEKTNHFKYRENIHAAYISLNRPVKKYNVTAGLRAEQTNTDGRSLTLGSRYENSYFNLFPNLSVLYMKSAKEQLSFAYRKSIVRYGFDFVNPFIVYQSQYTYMQGNPLLQPQINHSIELSHVYNYRVFTSIGYTRTLKALSPVYRQDLSRNLLISSYDNLASADILVGTVTLNKTFKKKWTSVNTIGGFYINYHFNQLAKSQGNTTLTGYVSSNNTVLLPRKFVFELTGVYRSPFASGIYKMNSYYTVSSGVSKSFAKNRGSLKINVTDIFNTQQFENTVTNYQNVNGFFTNKIESRFANLLLSWKFGNSNVRASKARKSITDEERNRLGAQ